MKIGIVALMHESNTFLCEPTTLRHFREDVLLEGPAVRAAFANTHHELGGFFAGLEASHGPTSLHALPLFAARALPAGPIDDNAFETLVARLLASVQAALPLDGLLVAAHGAAVSRSQLDADGHWLSRLRELVGPDLPIIATLDPHANLSPRMVAACNALIAYRTNPHLDQHGRGMEAANLMREALVNGLSLAMAAAFPPLCINIDRQCTTDPHWQSLYALADQQLTHPNVLSNSILLGFPYADVPDLGAAAVVVTRDNQQLAAQLAQELGDALWSSRASMAGQLLSVDQVLQQCAAMSDRRICLLDMGDNVGGGSAGDGTELGHGLLRHGLGPSFLCLCDPESVAICTRAGVGQRCALQVGGKTDTLHGPPLSVEARVVGLYHGRFREDAPRHGGIRDFDQGPTAVVCTDDGRLSIMLTSRRMVPFSLQQLIACGLDPRQFRILVAKGVNAPIAAYQDVCDTFLRVNTIGGTCADLTRMAFRNRRRPLFPFE